MKKKYTKIIKHAGKITLLLVFTFISVGSNPRATAFTVVNENNNLNKMVDVEQIGSAKKISIGKTTDLIAIANEVTKNTEVSLSRLSIDMDLGEPSGFTLDQFSTAFYESKYIGNDRHDVIKNNIDQFYNVEQKYGINGMFVLSIAVHESGWGTSKLALNSNNLFGYIGMSFDSYESCIDYVAKTLMQRYLNPKGETIKGLEQPATGIYHNGSTVNSVNRIYAGDKEWSQKVFNYMQHFYGNIAN